MALKIINTEDFADLRQRGGYYVDKTGFLEDFLEDYGSATLFTRPRRFGKTLFMSMLEEFFARRENEKEEVIKRRRALFHGLKVASNERLCTEWMHQYPVVSLTLKDVDKPTYSRALSDIQDLVCQLCSQHKSLLDSEHVEDADKEDLQRYLARNADEDTLGRSLSVLIRALSRHHKKSVIVLIDEYDVPVAKAEDYGYGREMLNFIRSFLSRALKTNSPNLKFAILTGCMRITKESLFTGLNHLDCYDIVTPTYSDVFGFTQDEVDRLLCEANLLAKKEELAEWYDGYCFGRRQDIYCPWSVLKHLHTVQKDPMAEPKPYWRSTGTYELPRDFAKRLPAEEDAQGKIAALLGGSPVPVAINDAMNYADVFTEPDNFWTLLYLTGYLTLERDPDKYADTIEMEADDSLLVIPNKEIQGVFKTEVVDWLKTILPESERQALYSALWAQDVQLFEKQLTALLVGSSFHDAKETYYHGMMYGIFSMKYAGTTSNGEAGRGLYDLVVPDKIQKRAAVLEFKRAASEKQTTKGIQEALEQIVQQEYDVRLRAEGYRTILHVGVAFCQKTAKVGIRAV